MEIKSKRGKKMFSCAGNFLFIFPTFGEAAMTINFYTSGQAYDSASWLGKKNGGTVIRTRRLNQTQPWIAAA